MPMTIATSANPISMSQAITDLIESIALEETALSHILHAESEKLHKAINMGEVTLEEIMNVNDTVMSMVNTINELEHTLRDSSCLGPFFTQPPAFSKAHCINRTRQSIQAQDTTNSQAQGRHPALPCSPKKRAKHAPSLPESPAAYLWGT